MKTTIRFWTFVAILAVLASAHSAHAEEAERTVDWHPRRWAIGTGVGALVAANIVIAADMSRSEKEPSALGMGTAIGLFGYSLLLSPLPGHIMSHRSGYGWLAAAGRIGLFIAGSGLDYVLLGPDDSERSDAIPIFSLLGLGAAVVWTVTDIIHLPSVTYETAPPKGTSVGLHPPFFRPRILQAAQALRSSEASEVRANSTIAGRG